MQKQQQACRNSNKQKHQQRHGRQKHSVDRQQQLYLNMVAQFARNSKQATQLYLNIVDNKNILEDPSDF
jgi:hypothetical protein